MKDIRSLSQNKITLDGIQEYYHIEEYQKLVEQIKFLIEKNHISPIKSSKLNGKKPPLYQRYRIHPTIDKFDGWKSEIGYLAPQLQGDYYIRNLDKYQKDREYILQLNRFFLNNKTSLNWSVSINERSFEIFGREKFLLKEGGIHLLRNLGLTLKDLNCYETSQPLAYYSHDKEEGQNILIIENKDTFYTMRRYLLEGNKEIFGITIGTLIYGGGKAIYRSVLDFDLCVEPYMRSKENKLYYFGDLDYEGILIYDWLKESMAPSYHLLPFTYAYNKMVEKSKSYLLSYSKKQQNKNCKEEFFSHFEKSIQKDIKDILEKGLYIPQEILTIYDL